MPFRSSYRKFILLVFFIPLALGALAQTQEDFDKKHSEVFENLSDSKKALAIAKELYGMVEKKKELQTYSNYYLLKNIFENQAPDPSLAKLCDEKATKAMNAMVGLPTAVGDTTNNPFNQWYYVIYPGLFSNKDPQIAEKAIAFIGKNETFRTADNLYWIAYAFERKGDFLQAKNHYETSMSMELPDKNAYRTYIYYANFLSRSGEYLKAEQLIRKMDSLALYAPEMFRDSYRSEALGARVVHYLNIGDYQSYIKAAEENVDYLSKLWQKNNKNLCDPYPGIRYTNSAYAKEMLREYSNAEKLWKSRDSANYLWVDCHNKTYPNSQYSPISMYPVYLIKRGKFSQLPKPVSFYIKETEDHYNSYKDFADISASFMKAVQLGFLRSNNYSEVFRPIMQQVKATHNFRESTQPFSYHAYFKMRDRKMDEAIRSYNELFSLNADWINDIIFTFGEKAFVTYYNSRLKEGYENYHSFVKLAKDRNASNFAELAGQAYSNLLFTKSISLKGTERRKEAFMNSNDAAINTLYQKWLEKKQQLIRQFMKTGEPGGPDTLLKINQELLTALQNEVSQLENELTIKAKDFKKYLKIPVPDWKSVRDQLKDGEAAIEMVKFQWRDQVYYSDTSYYAAYIITKTSQHPDVVYLAESPEDLENRFFKLYKNHIRLKSEDRDSYDRFWKPIRDKIPGIRKVYFSPDGIYHLINISTLFNPASGKFLLDEMVVQYTTAGTDINSSVNEKDIRTAVLIGRPTYKTSGSIPQPMAKPLTRSLVWSFRENNISDLPGTEEEVNSIKKEMDLRRIGVSTYLKTQATEDKLYALKNPGILHIATHGYWSSAGTNSTEGYRTFNAMANSGLLLSGVVNYYSAPTFADTYDGILTAYEAQNLNLENTSLVVLSACETSLGYLDAGEGVYGLQRAFRAAGASAIMTSLWKVDDLATKDFMIHFYQEFLRSKDRNAAFISAQRFTKEKYKHPYFWGAFVMMGE